MRARPGAGPWASGWTCGMRTTPRRRSGPLPAKSIEGTSTTTSGTAAAPNLPGGGPGDRGVRALLYVEFATGLRREGSWGLSVGPGLKHGVLRVRRQFSRINGEMVEAPLKTKNTYRALLLAENTVSVLEVQRKKTGSSPCVFPSPAGGPISWTAWGRCSTVRCGGRGCLGFSFTICGTLLPLCPPEWGGAEDGIRNTEALLGGVHPGHLRPCDHGLPTGRRPNYGQYPPRQAPDLTAP